MGLFTYIEIPDKFLPKEFKGMNKWHTKDIVVPIMGTIKILKDGKMRYSFKTTHLGGDGEKTYKERLSYADCIAKIVCDNGEDVNSKRWKIFRLKLEIVDGILQKVFGT